jgi:hypothetical protein
MGFIPYRFANILGVSLSLVNLCVALATDGSNKAVVCLYTHSLAIF